MRLAIVIDSLDLGGAERQAIMFAKFATERGHAVAVFARPPYGAAATLLEEADIPIKIYPRRAPSSNWIIDLWRNSRILANQVGEWKPDVIVSYMARPNLLSSFSWGHSEAHSWIWNQRDRSYGSGFYRRFFRWRLRSAPMVITNSDSALEELNSSFALNHGRCVVPNALKWNAARNCQQEWREKLAIDERDFVGVMIANIYPEKGQKTAIYAWKIVSERCSARPILIFAGKDYGMVAALREETERLGISEQVRFIGHIPDVSGLLSVADIGILSSTKKEGYSNAVMEYGAAGLPVVGTDIPGISEAIAPECRERSLFPANESAIMAEKILAYAADAELRHRDGAVNQAYILSRHDPEKTLGKMLAIVESSGKER